MVLVAPPHLHPPGILISALGVYRGIYDICRIKSIRRQVLVWELVWVSLFASITMFHTQVAEMCHTVFTQIDTHALIDACPFIVKLFPRKNRWIGDFCTRNAWIWGLILSLSLSTIFMSCSRAVRYYLNEYGIQPRICIHYRRLQPRLWWII